MQMEDEIAAICSCIGASWAGAKAMTVTSGPGFSLMQEGIGYAVITETPVVIVDAQRAGPSTGQATRVGGGDIMQAKWGTHGGNEVIALSPWSVQELYDQTIEAFNLTEKYRVPVMLMAEEATAHLGETMWVNAIVKTFEREKVSGQLIHHFAPHPQGEHCEFFRRRARDFDPSSALDSGAVGATAGA